MTAYLNSENFRRALEDRLRYRSLKTGIPLARLRKMVAFDRFLARFAQCGPGQWILKGGFAIELRLVGKARTTKDIDILILSPDLDVLTSLRKAGALDLADWFQFEVQQSEDHSQEGLGSRRYHIVSRLDGRIFEEFHLDVGIGDPVLDDPEYLEGPSLPGLLDTGPTLIPCYPITQQIAEKVHAYTRPHLSGGSSRVKDFIDILLLAELGNLYSDRLRLAIRATFDSRQTHSLPREMPDPPADWVRPYEKLAAEVATRYRTLGDANRAFKGFLNPILLDGGLCRWNPENWSWAKV